MRAELSLGMSSCLQASIIRNEDAKLFAGDVPDETSDEAPTDAELEDGPANFWIDFGEADDTIALLVSGAYAIDKNSPDHHWALLESAEDVDAPEE